MRVASLCLSLMTAAALAGCGAQPAATGSSAPLTVADWKTLPVDEKYTPETIERLKFGDPKLQTPEGWETFQKTVVGPARKKDFPHGPARR